MTGRRMMVRRRAGTASLYICLDPPTFYGLTMALAIAVGGMWIVNRRLEESEKGQVKLMEEMEKYEELRRVRMWRRRLR